ncbi:NAD(P)/FAD-dependent oxidoreductase [Radiobacillus kanasensis]|uniref:NAD(P)/FAD-dependent oxidoreductase n=1 Tax=Radiobacillus kanasensis TaxID=2844358 RepID=UPI001E36C1A3|nr:NAD(P)/FAD-dependent oxidoreductase [Radiobacillus kanasensis]UFT98298.1 NAD(P)/FAD-dependent oxidoreductase [Radiobacillus kanasensis]
MKHADVIILGGGPAGISAAIWCDRLGLDYLLMEQAAELGGQLRHIENAFIDYPGILTKNGKELQQHFMNHLKKANIDYSLNSELIQIDPVQRIIFFKNNGGIQNLSYRYLIVATGSGQRKLGIPGEQAMLDRGESYSATKDSPKFKNKQVAVIGGGDRAMEGALLLAEAGAHVHVIHRSEYFRARDQYLKEAQNHERIQIYTNTYASKINGEQQVNSLELNNVEEKPFILSVEAVFIRIGVEPNSHFLDGMVDVDAVGYIQTDSIGLTSDSSILAIGDVCTEPLFSSVSTAVGHGAVVAKYVSSKLKSK